MMPSKTVKAPVVAVEQIPSMTGGISAIASANAPLIYFDRAPCFGVIDGVVQITLEAVRLQPSPDRALSDRVLVGHLRTTTTGAKTLIESLVKALSLLEKPQGPAN